MLAQHFALAALACGQNQLFGQTVGIEEERIFELRVILAVQYPSHTGQTIEEATIKSHNLTHPFQTVKLAVLGYHRPELMKAFQLVARTREFSFKLSLKIGWIMLVVKLA
jgi:hypothetical protein